MGKRIDLTGKRFGRWTVVSESDLRDCNGNIMWNCKCDCGREKAVSGNSLRKGCSTSCGCYNHDVITKFGGAVYKEKLHSVWASIKSRCNCETDNAYHNYGKRGITVCKEWEHYYHAFKTWALENGYKPGMWIDRVDNNKGYSPENCEFKTPKEQQRNKRTTVFASAQSELGFYIFNCVHSLTPYPVRGLHTSHRSGPWRRLRGCIVR
jgi:hypothetical protein